MFALSLGFLC